RPRGRNLLSWLKHRAFEHQHANCARVICLGPKNSGRGREVSLVRQKRDGAVKRGYTDILEYVRANQEVTFVFEGIKRIFLANELGKSRQVREAVLQVNFWLCDRCGAERRPQEVHVRLFVSPNFSASFSKLVSLNGTLLPPTTFPCVPTP